MDTVIVFGAPRSGATYLLQSLKALTSGLQERDACSHIGAPLGREEEQ